MKSGFERRDRFMKGSTCVGSKGCAPGIPRPPTPVLNV